MSPNRTNRSQRRQDHNRYERWSDLSIVAGGLFCAALLLIIYILIVVTGAN